MTGYRQEFIASNLKEAAGLLVASSRPSVFTGAGISQESGLPTYRDTNGLWMGHEIDEVASALALHRDPQKVWSFFQKYRAKIQATQPNAGHLALAHLEKAHLTGLPIITQNIDDLHERAGSGVVVHLHGQVMQNRCSRYCQGMPSLVDVELSETLPLCPHCGNFVRPDVILFGEYLHGYLMDQANEIATQTDIMLIIGTSGLVAPASKIPLLAQDHGATLIEINPEPSRITSNVDLFIPLPSGAALSHIQQILDESL